MYLQAGCEIVFAVDVPTPMVLMLRPRSGAGQWIAQESYALTPAVPAVEYVDPYGNLCQRVVAPAGEFRIRTTVGAEVAAEIDVLSDAPFVPIQQLPDSVLHFLLPSRYCPSDMLGERAREIVGDAAPGYNQVETICAWIQRNIEYRYGTSDASTSATDTLAQRSGVCRDFAHLGMAFCRSLNIPARMVVGYLHELEPMDQHAWFEAYVGNRWFTFDATQAQPRGGRIAIAYGRDAADVAFATQFGPVTLQEFQVWVGEGQPESVI
jgi:transglutaminase-like putative cysteine protease